MQARLEWSGVKVQQGSGGKGRQASVCETMHSLLQKCHFVRRLQRAPAAARCCPLLPATARYCPQRHNAT